MEVTTHFCNQDFKTFYAGDFLSYAGECNDTGIVWSDKASLLYSIKEQSSKHEVTNWEEIDPGARLLLSNDSLFYNTCKIFQLLGIITERNLQNNFLKSLSFIFSEKDFFIKFFYLTSHDNNLNSLCYCSCTFYHLLLLQ